MPKSPGWEPVERIALALTNEERELILAKADVPPAIQQRLRLGMAREGAIEFRFTVQELEILIDAVADAWRLARGRQAARLDRIGRRIGDTLVACGAVDEDADNFDPELRDALDDVVGSLPPELLQSMLEICGEPHTDGEELDAFLAKTLKDSNALSREEIGGLSPAQLHALLTVPWGEEGSPIRINDRLAPEDVSDAVLVRCTRVLLAEIDKSAGVKATRNGFLNRKFVRRLIDDPALAPIFMIPREKIDKTVNEADIPMLHYARVLLDLADLLDRNGSMIRVSPEGRELARPERAASLLVELLKASIMQSDIHYEDGLLDCISLQGSNAYSLYRLSQMAGDWCSLETVMRSVLLPFARKELESCAKEEAAAWDGPVEPYFGAFLARATVWQRLVAPLEGFGLLETRGNPESPAEIGTLGLRKKPLFDRLLTFELA